MSTVPLERLWGERVASRRRVLGMTQRQLAELCDVAQQTISKIERGDIEMRDQLKITVSRKLGLSPAELFAWPEEISA